METNTNYNHKVLEKTHQFFETRAKELASEIINTIAGDAIKKEPASWSSYLPSLPEWMSWNSAGKGVGYVAGATFGQGAVNQGIDLVALHALQNRLGRWGAQGAAESLKVVAGNWLVPYLPTIFSVVGTSLAGAVGPMLGAGASYLVSFICNNNDPKKLALMDEAEIKEFLDENKLKFNKALIRLAGHVLQQELYANLFDCKTNGEVKKVLEKHVIHREPNPNDPSSNEAIVLKDGYVLNKKETKKFNKLIGNFTDESDLNFGGLERNEKKFRKILGLIGNHTAKASSEEAQQRKTADVIKCEDGIYCLSNGGFIDQAEAEYRIASHQFFNNNFQLDEPGKADMATSTWFVIEDQQSSASPSEAQGTGA